MRINGFIKRFGFRSSVIGSIALLSASSASVCQAQSQPVRNLAPPTPLVAPPAPLGSPSVEVGPPVNPYGPPPMAIGPAPAYGPQFYPQQYPGPVYPFMPYQVRRPAPFDPSRPLPVATPAPESQTVLLQRAEQQPVAAPAPMGNVRLTVSEGFLNRLVARDEQKPGEVNDFILGARVTGVQTTATKLRLDLLPSADNVRGALVLNGTTQSQTTGVTPQASVDTASQQKFLAYKEIFFDGTKFSTRHAVVQVQAQNQTLGATTTLSGTMLGGIANRIAFRAAERRQAEGEAIARDKVAERVYPEFDNAIDKQLGTANDQLEGTVRPVLRAASLMPTQQQVWSTDTCLNYSAQFSSDTPMTLASSLDIPMDRDEGARLLIHESFLNALVGRAGLKGLKTTDRDAKELLAPYEIKSRDEDLENAKPPIGLPGIGTFVTNIEFDETDPLTIRLEQDRAIVTLRASFKPAGQDVLPPLSVTIEYKTQVADDKIVVTPGKVQVAVLDKDDVKAPPEIALKMISQAIEGSLTKLAFDRVLPTNLWSYGGPAPRVTGIRSQDGWAAISIN